MTRGYTQPCLGLTQRQRAPPGERKQLVYFTTDHQLLNKCSRVASSMMLMPTNVSGVVSLVFLPLQILQECILEGMMEVEVEWPVHCHGRQVG